MAKPIASIGVVLAAGDGERMGGSKALLVVGDEVLALAHARRLLDAVCRRVVLVVRPEVLPRLGAPEGVTLVASRAADTAGSLAVAVREGEVDPDAVVWITPVDAAPVRKPTLEALVAALGEDADAATPRYLGKGGHPVVCRARVLAAYRSERPPPPLRDVIRALGDKRVCVDVEDPLVVVDLDTPEDVVALTGEGPRFAE